MTREPFINARQAARFVGFEPGDGPAGKDPGIRAFYAWVSTNRVPKHHRGPRVLVFRVSELEAAITGAEREDAPDASLSHMERLGREHILRVCSKR